MGYCSELHLNAPHDARHIVECPATDSSSEAMTMQIWPKWLALSILVLRQDSDVELDADRAPKTHTGGNCLIRNGTLHTVSARGTIRGDIQESID
jgi:hypothetical protein